jgi:DNA-directed RNA polymerase specialized sigma24 family protein
MGTGLEQFSFEALYRAKAAELILYGRALGLSHAEAEDVLQETFLAMMRRSEYPENPEHYCIRSYRNRALNYRRGFLRRLARDRITAMVRASEARPPRNGPRGRWPAWRLSNAK